MRTYEKSTKLDNVCYDIRGPVMDEANRMQAAGIDVLTCALPIYLVFTHRMKSSKTCLTI